MKPHDLTGVVFGSWEALEMLPERGKYGEVYWKCRCQCGTEKRVTANSLRNGTSTKCYHCSNKRHGMEGSSTYGSWVAMKKRCMNQNDSSYVHYGARGIGVCEKWQSFEGFFSDMGVKPEGTSIDRIDVEKGYFKENCRWATPAQQIRNRRDTRKYEWEGRQYALGDLAGMHNIDVRRVQQRLNAGWDLKSALTTSVRAKRNKQ